MPFGQRVVLSQLHVHEVGREVQHQRGVQLTTVCGSSGIVEIAGEVEGEDVYSEDPGPPSAQCRQGLLMGIMAVRGENNESVHAALLPRAEQVIHPTVQGLASHRRVPRVWSFRRGIDAVRDRRRAERPKAGRKIIGKPFND